MFVVNYRPQGGVVSSLDSNKGQVPGSEEGRGGRHFLGEASLNFLGSASEAFQGLVEVWM